MIRENEQKKIAEAATKGLDGSAELAQLLMFNVPDISDAARIPSLLMEIAAQATRELKVLGFEIDSSYPDWAENDTEH